MRVGDVGGIDWPGVAGVPARAARGVAGCGVGDEDRGLTGNADVCFEGSGTAGTSEICQAGARTFAKAPADRGPSAGDASQHHCPTSGIRHQPRSAQPHGTPRQGAQNREPLMERGSS